MNLAFFKSRKRHRPGALSLLFVFCLLARGALGTDALWKNTGTIIYLPLNVFQGFTGNTVAYPPQIDATNFVNQGTWGSTNLPYGGFVVFPDPYMTRHTLNYTNTVGGAMYGAVGWEFDYGPLPTGGRGMSANFVNNGMIRAYSGGLANPVTSAFGYPMGYLWVSATNIVNKNGTLAADAACEIKLVGTNVNLSRSAVKVFPISGSGSSNGRSNFVADTAIYDEYWAQTNVNSLNSMAIWGGTYAATPLFIVGEPCGVTNASVSIGPFIPALSDYVSNAFYAVVPVTNEFGSNAIVVVATNVFLQGVFVNINDPTIGGAIRFSAAGGLSNLFETVAVELVSLTSGDTVYLVDTLASLPGRGLLANYVTDPAALCSGPTYRPTNYVVTRLEPFVFAFGSAGNGTPPPNLLYDGSWTNLYVSAAYAGYSCLLDYQAAEPPPNPGLQSSAASITNVPGRIHIYADSLNLSNAQIRAEGEILIQANHLIGSQNAVMDCGNLSYNLGGTTNGNLNVTDLALPQITRFHGTVSAWSAVWSNQTLVVIDNYTVITNIDTNTSPPTITVTNIYTPLTNTVQINLHALLVDGSGLSSVAPVSVYDLILHGTNMVVNDTMSVVQSFLLDGLSFTLNGSLTFPGFAPLNPVTGVPFSGLPIQSWFYTNAPTLRYFTNNGSLSIPNEAHFGDGGPTNYAAFVNTGAINAFAQVINSDYFENDGTLSAGGGFSVTTLAGESINGRISAGSDVQFFANALKFNRSSVQTTGGALDLFVTNSLSDPGGGSGNSFRCGYGFNLWLKPATGDLLGSAFTTVAPNIPSMEIDHAWAGINCGPSNSGYTNNVALGQLVLVPQGSVTANPPLFLFAGATGAGVTNGLYVDLLDLSALGTNWNNIQQNLMQIDSSLVIYYAAAKVGFTPPPAAFGLPPQEPEEFLDGQFDGHLRWVKTFAGPNSSVDVVIKVNGVYETFAVNKALRFATTIDSNTNGIPNYADPYPFSVPPSGSIARLTLMVSLVPPPGQSSPKALNQSGQSSSSVVALSWLAATNTAYQVQFTTNLSPANWQPLLTYTNSATTSQMVTIFDTNAPAIATKRFYRVGYGP